MRAELETEYGTMGAIRIEGDDETLDIALLDLADVKGQALPDHLEGAGAARKETQPLLFTTSDHDQVHFRRDATEAEKRILARKTDIRYANLEATFETEVGGFVVAAHDGTDAGYTTVELDGAEYREVAPGQINGATVTRNVQPQSCTWDCTRCLAKAGKCTGCCLAANVGCIACIIWQCGVGASVCHDCYDCLS
ncbi:hypothetical protein RBH26_21255 [Natronolimnohabitans sp. A-GB9]|uniref:hypothetical protein n=1 Tax=Natronolimnohabitans sp. A-GB9 TaxID=3069757 RepID=UPI0027AEA1CA|nr:hypothetical protein [Natronolimnohabitans sp. A-GB9]MDQ2052974.1 hypothetical protein [Natronolimnohabitans sp. A-GB9]